MAVKELTEKQVKVLRLLTRWLSGTTHVITAKQIVKYMKAPPGPLDVTDKEISAIALYCRLQYPIIPFMSCNEGYFWAAAPKDMDKTIRQLKIRRDKLNDVISNLTMFKLAWIGHGTKPREI